MTILRRTPKGGGSSGGRGGSSGSSSGKGTGSTGGTTVVVVNGGTTGGRGVHIPWWAYLIIVSAIIFLVALAYQCVSERKANAKGKDKKFGAARAVWTAFTIATGLWIPIYLCKLLLKLLKRKTYSKIGEGHSTDKTIQHGDGSSAADVPYSQGGSGFKQNTETYGARYEPMGLSAATDVSRSTHENDPSSSHAQPIITGPIEQTNAIPLLARSPSPAPSMCSAVTAPPPYTGGPAQPSYVQAPQPTASQTGHVRAQSKANDGLSATYSPAANPYSGAGYYQNRLYEY